MVGLKMIGDEGHASCPECGLILYKDVSECPRCFALIKATPPESPMVERVYVPDITERPPKERQDIKRIGTILLIIVIVAILIISLSYHFIIPRIELKVITQYQESSGLVINLDSKVRNEGTLNIQHFSMNITILNSSDGVVAKGDYYISDLDAHSSHSFDNIHFFGDQYEPYQIKINISFESSGKDYSESYDHNVKEYIRQRYEDNFMRWGG
ncbi:MAG: hypothetical protein V3U20_03195 [Thermoplasmata archaeon]